MTNEFSSLLNPDVQILQNKCYFNKYYTEIEKESNHTPTTPGPRLPGNTAHTHTQTKLLLLFVHEASQTHYISGWRGGCRTTRDFEASEPEKM